MTVDVIVAGLIPAEAASIGEESATAVVLFFGEPGSEILDDQIVKRGHADKDGQFRASVDSSKVGETITCRMRHAAYEFLDESILIMPFGAYHAAKMRKDQSYSGRQIGTDVGDLDKYHGEAARTVESYRMDAFRKLYKSGYRLSQIPFLYWFRYYFIGVIAFAIDYWLLGSHFESKVDSSVDALYLSAVTVTTLGYGDIVPTHTLTKLLTGLQALSGVVLIGLLLNLTCPDLPPETSLVLM